MLPPFLNNPLISVADKQSAMNRQMGVLTDDGQGKQGQLKGTVMAGGHCGTRIIISGKAPVI